MIVTRADILAVFNRQRDGRTGLIEPDEADATRLWTFGKSALPVLVQAEAAFWEMSDQPLTPCMAALALALHHAEPQQFQFGNCLCKGQYLEVSRCHERPGPPCDRRLWLDQLRERATLPANVATAQTIRPVRA